MKRREFEKAVEVGLKSYNLDRRNGVIAANLSVAYHYVENFKLRDKFFEIAKQNGYKNPDALQEIFSGEYTILDD